MRCLLTAILALAAALAHGQEIVTLATRAGATQSYLLLASKGAPVQAAAVLFPGGAGVIRLRTEDGRIAFSPSNTVIFGSPRRQRCQALPRGTSSGRAR